MEIEQQYKGLYPASGRFKGDMAGLIESCKVATADCVAAGRAPQSSPVDIFACHLYTRPELAPLFNAAYLDGLTVADEVPPDDPPARPRGAEQRGGACGGQT